MEASLAIYEALLQANVPAAAARDVAEKLERDMTNVLATRQDMQRLETRMDAGFALIDERLIALRREMDTGFAAARNDFVAVRNDMGTGLAAVRNDMATGFEAVRKEMDAGLAAIRKEMSTGFATSREEMDARFALWGERLVSLENRILIKLGGLMTFLLTLAVGALKLVA